MDGAQGVAEVVVGQLLQGPILLRIIGRSWQ